VTTTIDRSKPLKDQFKVLAIEAELIEPDNVLTLPSPQEVRDTCAEKCDLPEEDSNKSPPFDLDVPSDSEPDGMFKHKLGEAVLPLSLLPKFIAMFPAGSANRVQVIADPVTSMVTNMRHIFVYDTLENLRKYEK
jgi:hypothetical protein